MANAKEAQARVKINKLLESAGWRFFDEAKGKANIALESNVKLESRPRSMTWARTLEATKNGFVDFLLLDEKSFPLVVLEAKSEDKNPLVGKEQARKYAKSLDCRFVILSNGNLHYFWDLQQGNPHIITAFPTPDSLKSYRKFNLTRGGLITDTVGHATTSSRLELPGYEKEAGWLNADERRSSSPRTSCASYGTTRRRRSMPSRTQWLKARHASCSKWRPALARP